jgi:NAD(P)H-hydrate epimerase
MTRFVTDAGVEVPAVTEAQMRELDRIAVEETGPNLFQMMENAGRGLAALALERLGQGWRSATVLVLAGPGGNGGGGLCAARHLANRGLRVRVCLAEPEGLREVPAWQRRVLAATPAEEVPADRLGKPDLVLDALVGYGLRSAPRGLTARLIEWTREAKAPVLSLDLPSGIDATSGAAPGAYVRAAATLTLALPKTGLAAVNGRAAAGEVFLADLGIPEGAFRRLGLAQATPFDRRFHVPLQLIASTP